MQTFPTNSLRALLDYVYSDEERDYEASTSKQKSEHIFNHIKLLSQWEYTNRKGLNN